MAKDGFGRRLDAISAPTTPAGYAKLLHRRDDQHRHDRDARHSNRPPRPDSA